MPADPITTTSITLYAAAIGGAVAAALTGAFAIWNNRVIRISEERKHIRELGFKIGLANFENVKDIANQVSKPGELIKFPGLHLHIMVGIKQMEIVYNPHLTANQIASELAKLTASNDEIIRACHTNR